MCCRCSPGEAVLAPLGASFVPVATLFKLARRPWLDTLPFYLQVPLQPVAGKLARGGGGTAEQLK